MKKAILVVFFSLVLAFGAKAQFVDGTKGLLCMPSAEMEAEGTFMISNNILNKEYLPTRGWGYNTFGYAFSITFWSRLEIAYSLTIFNGKHRPNPSAVDMIMFNQDRHFAARFQLLKENEFGWKWMPSIVAGVSDPVTGSGGGNYIGSDVSQSNGYFNRYYIAAAKHFQTPWGEVAGHLAYQYSQRVDGMPTGPCAAVTWNPVWLNREDAFVNSFRATLEYDARKLNFGLNVSIFRDHFEFMTMLFGMKHLMVGARYKLVLKQ